jgi:ribosomal protein S18 acetylase RimI-like enzyme
MTLPEPVRRFCYAAWGLEAAARRMPWGVVTADADHPLIHDANNACVLEADPTLTPEAIRAALHPLLEDARVAFEHLEFWEASDRIPALRELRLGGAAHPPDLVMVFEGARRERGTPLGVAVQDVRDPDPSFWPWYRRAFREFDVELTEPELDQLTERARTIFHPAGLRWFVGTIDGERAGYTSVLALEGVAYVDNVVTLPAFRRRGVASATVTAAVRTALAEGNELAFLLAEQGAAPARLYERLGFRTRAQVETFHRPFPP